MMLGLLIISALSVKAQTGVDDLFLQARELAFDGKRKEARALCATILERSPAYHDVRLLMGRTYAWDGDYEAARREIKIVVESKPDYADARDALIDVELWSGNPKDALRYAEEGLERKPDNDLFLYKKARALKAMGDLKGAVRAAQQTLEINPDHKEAQSLLESLKESNQLYKMTIDYSYDAFDSTFAPWNQVSVSLTRAMSFGPLIGRVNYAHRFGISALQYEVDAYPKIRRRTPVYLNAGYSSSSIYPRYRFGGEIYQGFRAGVDASIGMRHLRFPSGNVNIYTGSIGKYYGNYWISFRPFITPSDTGTSHSGIVLIRRYLEDADNYVTLSLSAGTSPDERYTTFDQFRLKSQSAGFDFRKRFGKGVIGSAYFGFTNQEIGFGQSRKRYSMGFAIEKYF